MTETDVVKRYQLRPKQSAPTRRPSIKVDYEALLRSHEVDGEWPDGCATVEELVERGRPMLPYLSNQPQRLPGLRRMLTHLSEFPGDSWQDRWVAAGHEADPKLWTSIPGTNQVTTHGLHLLLVLGAVRPSYHWLKSNQFKTWYQMLLLRDPAQFRALEEAFEPLGRRQFEIRAAMVVLAHIACRTGKRPGEINGNDLLAYTHAMRAIRASGKKIKVAGVHLAWDALRVAGTLNHPADTLRLATMRGQLTVVELVDQYDIESARVRECLIKYLRVREGALDYSTLNTLAATLCRYFWSDIERHHPGIDTLTLPEGAAEDWIERMSVKADGSPRRSRFNILMQVRAMYLDIANWAFSDNYWVQWVAPSPVNERDVVAYSKHTKEAKARSHQRTRERAPEVDRLLRSTETHRRAAEQWLAEVSLLPNGAVVEHDGRSYTRIGMQDVMLRPLGATDQLGDLNVSRHADDAFWAWAVVHLLHQTGLRIEELLELDQFSIQRFRHPQTGDVIPLLHVYPSKSGSERLLAASPELVHVLARIIHRLRQPDGTLPLTSRYDTQEKRVMPPAPLLFQRYRGRWLGMSYQYVYALMDLAGTQAGLTRVDGKPLKFRPHDLRRIFATDAQNSGVPIHVIAALLGHESIETTTIYTAVYDETVISAHSSFIAHRRSLSPQPEQRDITPEEWDEFQRHFVERRLSLGSCGRAWGSDCQHEHACVRCSLLRPDPEALDRFVEIRDNLVERISWSEEHGYLGDVEGLSVSLLATKDKIRRIEAMLSGPTKSVALGMPEIRSAGR